jgi:hypothetical protein
VPINPPVDAERSNNALRFLPYARS